MLGEDDVFYDADEDETIENETASLPTTASGQGTHESSSIMSTVRNSQVFDNDRLEKCGSWLLAIPRDDVIVLRQTPEYEEFLQAFDRLGMAHRRVLSMNRIQLEMDEAMHSESEEEQVVEAESRRPSNFSFLQHLAVDDVLLRIFEFLECRSLSRTQLTCSRFRELAHRSAAQRTQYEAHTRQLSNAMQLLRAKEQIDGVGNLPNYFHVRVPMLGLSRRVIVTNAGDPEYNGVYFCTEVNSNGFVFTKPRSQQRVMSVETLLAALPRPPPPPPPAELPIGDGPAPLPPVIAFPPPNAIATNGEGGSHRGHLLKCFIARRFSNEVRVKSTLRFVSLFHGTNSIVTTSFISVFYGT